MKKILFVLLAIMAAVVPFAYASHGVEEAMSSVRSPEDIVRFFSEEFTYTMTLPDRAHSPEETIASHAGDCEDFAILASAMLTRMGIENQVFIIKFNDLKIMHAVCVWKDKNGFYSFISNKELQRTGQRTAEGAVRKFYPDCSTIASIDPQMYVKTNTSEMSVAKSYRGSDLMTNLDPRMSRDL